MIYGKRDATGLYQDNRLKNYRRASLAADSPIADSMHLNNHRTVRVPLTVRLKAMFRDLRSDKGVALNKSRSYEIEIFPSVTNEIKPKRQTGALHIAGRSKKFWPARNGEGCNEVQTPSNLG